ncbi:MAG: hypothetical protein PWQ16_1314 [bacterium]|nr:MAG: Glycosyl hydrolase, family 8 [bacterium 42_11]MDK2871962.1 hypothetical protein [bacterium]
MNTSPRRYKSLFLPPLIILLIFLSSCGSGISSLDISMEELKEGIKLGLDKELRSPQGLLYTSTKDKSFLSETIGLEMIWRLLENNKEKFDFQFSLLKQYFISPTNLLYWKITEDFQKLKANATIDDLRVCKALILAYKNWGDTAYIDVAKQIGKALLDYCTYQDILLDGVSWESGGFWGGIAISQETKSITLSYSDFEAMFLLREINPNWLKVVQRTLGIVLVGALLRESDVYWGYNISDGSYNDNGKNLINKLLHLLHLASVGSVPIDHVRRLSSKLYTEGGLFDYSGNENIAVYSLAALLFHQSGFYSEAELALDKLKNFRLENGLLGYPSNNIEGEAWAFDNLLALIAIETILQDKGKIEER